ncbi:hypothetical protein JTB14_014562 [Gonioctena quinquepunctata]|nr:hypothetical protein JTB14_014562 [Gonioctena quinquepunctata]
MQKGVEPDKDNWDIHELRIEGYSATLDGARKKAADSEYSTNEECQDAGRGRRIKIPPAWTQDHISGSSSDEETMTPPPTPKLKSTHGALLPDPQKGNSNNVEVVAEGGVRKKTVSGSFGKKRTEWDKMENSQLNKSSSDRSETPTLFPSPKQNIQPEEPINNSDDVAAGTAITLETLYEEIVKLRTIY